MSLFGRTDRLESCCNQCHGNLLTYCKLVRIGVANSQQYLIDLLFVARVCFYQLKLQVLIYSFVIFSQFYWLQFYPFFLLFFLYKNVMSVFPYFLQTFPYSFMFCLYSALPFFHLSLFTKSCFPLDSNFFHSTHIHLLTFQIFLFLPCSFSICTFSLQYFIFSVKRVKTLNRISINVRENFNWENYFYM